MVIHWTYSKTNLRASEVSRHERSKARISNDTIHIGGLERSPIFTHCITGDGRLFPLNYIKGEEIHLALIGGVDDDYKYKNTANSDQLSTLGNLVRFYMSMGETIKEGDLLNFNLEQWVKGISK